MTCSTSNIVPVVHIKIVTILIYILFLSFILPLLLVASGLSVLVLLKILEHVNEGVVL